jgi:hypothetical protein
MSRSGYSDDYDDTGLLGLYRANVTRSILGKRGQAFLREMAESLDAMPVKKLVYGEVVRDSEHVCAMGFGGSGPQAGRVGPRRGGRHEHRGDLRHCGDTRA